MAQMKIKPLLKVGGRLLGGRGRQDAPIHHPEIVWGNLIGFSHLSPATWWLHSGEVSPDRDLLPTGRAGGGLL